MVQEEKFFYSWISLMAEIGGYVGLLMGVSFFHGARWVCHLLDRRSREVDRVNNLDNK